MCTNRAHPHTMFEKNPRGLETLQKEADREKTEAFEKNPRGLETPLRSY